jgi:hypothetical protein
VVLRKTLKRDRVLEYFTQLEPCTVALEAFGGAHYWYREISKLGHTVRLLPTNKVKPYLDGNKNNAHDAAAICEASSRPSMRFVEPKTALQQDLGAPFTQCLSVDSHSWPQEFLPAISRRRCGLPLWFVFPIGFSRSSRRIGNMYERSNTRIREPLPKRA